MQKSFILVALFTLIGAYAIFYHIPPNASNAVLAFAIGSFGGALITTFFTKQSILNSNKSYNGPSMTLYVGNLPYRVHEGEVKSLFAQYGSVNSVRLVRDRKTGRRKGFGFVEMSKQGAHEAMNNLNDFIFQERTIKVREAKTQESSPAERNYGNL